MTLSVTDLFCGAGGSSIGAEQAGAELRLGLNHWKRAIETHATNFPHADHDCEDVSSLTTSQIRRYPDSDILLASPECTNHSLAKGARRRKPQAGSLFEDGPAGDEEQDRSRATMWDVVRFAEQKLLKGKPYKAIVVENVVDAFKWGANDDGGLFAAWRSAMHALGYESEIVWLNSMFCPPTPQSRDRMYVVFWLKGVRRPDLRFEPPSWCVACEALVDGQQAWKRPERPWGRYGAQYVYRCPTCNGVVLPGVYPAASAIDWQLIAPRIGDRVRPLAVNTRERIRRGLERLASEPFAIRLTHGGAPRPLTLPIVTLTQRHDLAVVLPIAGNTFDALVYANRKNGIPRLADEAPAKAVCTGGHIGVVMRNNRGGAEMSTPVHEPFRALTTRCHQSLVVPYQSEPHGPEEPARTITTRDRLALIVPPMGDVVPRVAHLEPAPTQTTTTRAALVEVTDDEIDGCGFRMFDLHEIAATMAMDRHPVEGVYKVLGNKRERMAQYGNAVTPPVMQELVKRCAEALA